MKRALALLVGFVGAAVAGEGAARVAWDEAAWMYELTPRQVADVEVHRLSQDAGLLYELAPGASLERDGRAVTISPEGLRGGGPRGEPLRVLALGGSNTYGPMVSDEETWPAALDRELPGVEVLNAGTCGYMTRQKVALAERLVPQLEPDLILLQIYNEGRRFVLEDTLDDAYARWPELYEEYFVGGRLLPSRSALVRLAVLGWNRTMHADAVWDRTERANQQDRDALARLVDQPVPVVVVLPPLGGPDTALRGLDVPVMDLASAENPFGAAGLEIHPTAEVYAWYAEVLAAGLREGGHINP